MDKYTYVYIRRIKRFPAKTFTNVGMVQRVIKNRVRAPTHHTGNKSPDTRRGPLYSISIGEKHWSGLKWIRVRQGHVLCITVDV